MKKIVASLLCISLIFTQYKQAEAAVPVAVAAVAAGSALLVAAGAVSYYSSPSTANSVISAAGQMYTNATAYTKAVNALGQSILLQQAAALSYTAEGLKNALANTADDAYQSLKGLLEDAGPLEPVTPDKITSSDLPVGSFIKPSNPADTNTYKTTSGAVYLGRSGCSSSYTTGTAVYWFVKPAGSSLCDAYTADIRIATPDELPQPVPAPLADYPKRLAGDNTGGAIASPSAEGDLRNLIGSGALPVTPVSVSGTATGTAVLPGDKDVLLPPYVPPSAMPVTGEPVTPVVTGPTTTTGLGSATTTAAQQNVTTSQQQVTTVEQQLAADPTNTDLQQQLVAAQQALAAAQAALDQAKAAEDEVYVNPLFPNRKTLNLESWRQLVNVLPSKFPFNLVTTLGSYFEPFLADPVAPAFELHIYQDKKLNIDLSVFDTPVSIFRWGLALLLTFGMVQLLIRWWKGTA